MRKEMGLLMLDTKFNRVIGDVGNENTFNFPVRKKIISGATANLIVKEGGEKLLEPFIDGCRELEKEGVSFIATSCGFLARFQKELSNSVDIPVITSSLLQIRSIYPLLKENSLIGVLTIRKSSLKEEHFKSVGCENIPKVVYGMEGTSFEKVFMDTEFEYNEYDLRNDITCAISKMISENKNIGAIVCECTNMPPFTDGLSDKFGIPIFNINTLINYIYSSLDK